MTDRPSYPSDARWRLVEPIPTAWLTERRGNGLDFGLWGSFIGSFAVDLGLRGSGSDLVLARQSTKDGFTP